MKYELKQIDSVTKVLVPVADEPEPSGKKKKEESDNGRDAKKPL